MIVAEPTGWHYLAPVANAIQRRTQARLYLADHQIGSKVRQAHISSQKTDKTDARALALIAQHIRERRAVRGVSPYDQELENYVIHLRLLVNSHARTIAEAARLKNRLRRLAHGIDPVLSSSTLWLTCLAYGKASPREVVEQTAGQRPDDMTAPQWARLQKFGTLLSESEAVEASSAAVSAALELYSRLRELEESAARLEAQAEQIITHHSFDIVTRRWFTVLYATPIALAALHVATYGKAEQIETEQFKAALGAFPQVKSSSATHQSSAHKKGYRPAMNALLLWTLHLVKSTASITRSGDISRVERGMAAGNSQLHAPS
jgi:hypothetical protein